jgi:hypothetical protein
MVFLTSFDPPEKGTSIPATRMPSALIRIVLCYASGKGVSSQTLAQPMADVQAHVSWVKYKKGRLEGIQPPRSKIR